MAQKMIRGNGEPLTWSVPLLGVASDGDASVDLTSTWLQAADRNISLHAAWTGTTNGTFFVDVSNDAVNVAYTLAASDFFPAPMPNPSGGVGSSATSFTTNFVFFRLRFVRISGSGKLTCVGNMKR